MAIPARGVLLRVIRSAAFAGLHLTLRLTRVLDPLWPKGGEAARRLILRAWWSLGARAGTRIRDLLRGSGTAAPAGCDPRDWPDVPADRIALPTCDRPLVSVIIPTFGQLPYTLRCLASIARAAPAAPIEVLVIDDAFPGGGAEGLATVRGIRLIRNPVNLGFLRTCNAAARQAAGEFLLFLNNDTCVRPDWLDAMLDVFAARPDAGLVGSKLLNPDGTLQEAGGILWVDGSGWNLGRGGDPGAPEFNYVREADYCSGASLLVRRTVFLDSGGFDERYAPAYCEDCDLAFRLRARGLKTYYQPRSEVVHFEGVSHGRDLAAGVKAFQVRNQARFLDVWHTTLARGHFLNGTHVMRARDRAPLAGQGRRQVVLVMDHYVPEPDRDAGSKNILAFMRALLAAGMVVKFWPANLRATPGYAAALREMGIEVLAGPNQAPLHVWLRANGGDLDVVLLSRPDVADLCLNLVRAETNAHVVYYGIDLHFRRLESEAGGRTRESVVMRERERAIWRGVNTALYPSEEEAAMARALEPRADIRAVVPFAFGDDAAGPATRPPPARPLILFVAGFAHPPNARAAEWMVQQVFPAVRAAVPGASLAIVGSHPPERVRALAAGAVSLFENVTDADLVAWYRRARVAVVPLLAGAGVKLKTVEALWHGVPLVATSIGAQGLPGVETVAMIEDSAEMFARRVVEVLRDDLLWHHHARAQALWARERFSASVQRRSLLNALTPKPVARGEVPRTKRIWQRAAA